MVYTIRTTDNFYILDTTNLEYWNRRLETFIRVDRAFLARTLRNARKYHIKVSRER